MILLTPGCSMIVFDRLVDQALSKQEEYSILRTVVEKEILHHDILRILNENGLLKHLVFIGGTCLRDCYGSARLSEDLDFTGTDEFDGKLFNDLIGVFKESFIRRYDLPVEVRVPKHETGTVKTWKLLIQTRADKHLPAQRIHIDIIMMPSYEYSPRMLINNYGIDLGTSGLILQAQSRAEILTDKYIALGLRSNRIKNRDLWDIIWLKQNGIIPVSEILVKKLKDFKIAVEVYIEKMDERVSSLSADENARADFIKEMTRFLPSRIVSETVTSTDFWIFLYTSILENWNKLKAELSGGSRHHFIM